MADQRIQGVYDDDLPGLLVELDLKEDFDNSKIKCAFCGDVITMKNFFGIHSDGKDIKFYCNKEVCRVTVSQAYGEQHT